MSPAASIALAVLALRCSALQLASDAAAAEVCGFDLVAFEAPHALSGVCYIFCVPTGECLQQAQIGELSNFGITEEGNCKRHGYTLEMAFGNTSARMAEYLTHITAACKGLSMVKKFKKPATTSRGGVPGAPPVCAGKQVPFEGISAAYPGICSRFCVPAGECQERAMNGALAYLGITGPGDCESKGFTQKAPMTDVTLDKESHLAALSGPCQGTTLTELREPEPAGGAAPLVPKVLPKGGPGTQACLYEQASFRSLSRAYPGICSRFCVPEGACQDQALKGGFTYLGITGPGDCKSAGYTVVAQMTDATLNTKIFLEGLTGPCQGMTLTKFQKPTNGVVAPGCTKEKTAFAGIAPLNPHMCSVYCVPEGECTGKVQRGAMSLFGIMEEGDCKKSGFTEFLPPSTIKSKYVLNGPCRGIERFNFLKPGLAGH